MTLPKAIPENLRTGVSVIDADHDELLELLNTCELQCSENANSCYESFVRLLKAHFATEENYMEAVEYPDLVRHRQHHEIALRKLGDLDRAEVPTFIDEAFKLILIDIVEQDLSISAYLMDNGLINTRL